MEPVQGHIYLDGEMRPFEMSLENGLIADLRIGDSVDLSGSANRVVALPPLANAHTHIGDAFIEEEISGSIMDVVAPPDGLKHRRMRKADDREIVAGMAGALEEMYTTGVRRFADFREQGLRGVILLKEALDSFNGLLEISGNEPITATILGRPESGDDIDKLLTMSDGLGISSITDHDMDYLRELRKETKHHKKLFALHVSERIREDTDFVLELRPDFIIHMNEATDDDMRKVAEAGIPVVVCPSSNMFFGKIPPVRRMMDAGIKVALGTDNLMLNPPSILREMSILNLAAHFAGAPLTYQEIIRIGVDNTRELAGMEAWRPREGELWDGILLYEDYGGGWKRILRE